MSTDLIFMKSDLSRDACRDRVARAASGKSTEILDYALSSQVEVVDGGDRFEVRHKLEPAVFSGEISPSGAGSVIRGQIDVPGKSLYRYLIGFVGVISIGGLTGLVWDLLFGTHILLIRSRAELGPGHPATRQEHFAVFVLLPLVAIPTVAMLWPKARGLTGTADQAIRDSLKKMFLN